MDDWIRSLDDEAAAAVAFKLEMLREFGVDLQFPNIRHLGAGLWELRARDPDGIYRVLYFRWRARTFGLLHGFTKKTQRTPRREIELAEMRMNEWLSHAAERRR